LTPEGALKDRCRKRARREGMMFWNVEGKAVKGIPDTICEHTDRLGVVWVEFKAGKNQPSEQQLKRADEIKHSGDRVVFCWTYEQWCVAVGLAP
jgi:hypothetical protein